MQGILGEIRLFAGTFSPRSWAYCHGQLLPISQFDALFSLIGTTYGGDGRTTFALPDMQGRVLTGAGHLTGGSNYTMGQKGGTEQVTLTTNQIPHHNHLFEASKSQGTTTNPTNAVYAAPHDQTSNNQEIIMYLDDTPDPDTLLPFKEDALDNTGGNLPHDNRQPYLSLNYIICMYGIYPSFS